MKITKQMLEAAMRKAVEAGLLPRGALREESFADREVIRLLLEAAMDAVDTPRHVMASRNMYPSWRGFARPPLSARPGRLITSSREKRG